MSDNGVNPTLTLAENIFKSLVWDSILDAQLAALYADAPYLLPIKWLIDPLAKMFENRFFSGFRTTIDVAAIKLLNAEHASAMQDASVRLAVIAHDKGINSDEFKKAREADKIALSRFTRINR